MMEKGASNGRNIVAVVTLYHPDVELLRSSLGSYAAGVDKVLLWRNSPFDEGTFSGEPWGGNLSYLGDGTNKGIPTALNQALGYAQENGYDYLLAMDQDSVWEDFEGFRDTVLSLPQADSALFGPEIPGTGGPVGAGKGTLTQVEVLFTSGTFASVALIGRIGGWFEGFFVDAVDNDFCYNARSKGIPSYVVGGFPIRHTLGAPQAHKFLWFRPVTRNYPPERLYGIFRNHTIILRKYSDTGTLSKRLRRELIRKWKILFFEKQPFRKYSAIFRGLRDGRRYPL